MGVLTCLKCGVDYLHESGVLLCKNCKKDDKMKIISCDRCGVVLDQDKLTFPDVYNHDTQEVILDNCLWLDNEYVSVTTCPCCGNKIMKVK